MDHLNLPLLAAFYFNKPSLSLKNTSIFTILQFVRAVAAVLRPVLAGVDATPPVSADAGRRINAILWVPLNYSKESSTVEDKWNASCNNQSPRLNDEPG